MSKIAKEWPAAAIYYAIWFMVCMPVGILIPVHSPLFGIYLFFAVILPSLCRTFIQSFKSGILLSHNPSQKDSVNSVIP